MVKPVDFDVHPLIYPSARLPLDDPEELESYVEQTPMELFDAWRDAIVWMRHLVLLWRAAEKDDRKKLAQFVSWEGEERVVFRHPVIDTWEKYSKSSDPEIEAYRQRKRDRSNSRRKGVQVWGAEELTGFKNQPLFRPGDLKGPALLFVQRWINDALQGAVQTQLYWSTERQRSELTHVPNGLLEAMYLQFAQSIDKGWQHRQCPVCLKYFQLSPGLNRANRQTCSLKCRTYLYRRRMAKARQLHAEGKTAGAIAKHLKTTVKVVRKWLEKGKEK